MPRPLFFNRSDTRESPSFSGLYRNGAASPLTETIPSTLKVYREQQSFVNSSRSDGLVLRHWSKRPTGHPATPKDPSTPNGQGENKENLEARPPVVNTHWAKYNSRVDIPEYTDEEYTAHLTSSEWSKSETDYLFQLACEFDLRWIVIADRYDYQPPNPQPPPAESEAMNEASTASTRTMEDLKTRYYDVAAKALALRTPLDSMSASEFSQHETMSKFDGGRERTRKRLVEALLARSPEEAKEEEILLGELKRIVLTEDAFLQERAELYATLDFPAAQGSVAQYESFAGLMQLVSSLHQADRSKRKSAARLSGLGAADGAAGASSPAQATPGTAGSAAGGPHRASHGGATGGHMKKGSISSTAAGTPLPTRQLTTREETKFGVAKAEKAGSGVSFRQGRLDKLLLAKSTAQANKLADALAELGVPGRAVMPTGRVCAAYEELVGKVHNLLEARKMSEKIGNELRVLQAQKAGREARERGEGGDQKDQEAKENAIDAAVQRDREQSSRSAGGAADKEKPPAAVDDDVEDQDVDMEGAAIGIPPPRAGGGAGHH